MKEYNIEKLKVYLNLVNNRVEKYVTAIRADIEQNVVTWTECDQLAEAADLAGWIDQQLHHLEGMAKNQRFSIGHLYRCKQSDPLQVIKQGKLYQLREWKAKGKYIVCGEGFAISNHVIHEYFERVTEPEDKPTD